MKEKFYVIIKFLLVISIVIFGSIVMTKYVKKTKKEKLPTTINMQLTVKEFGKQFHLENSTLKRIFGLKTKTDLNKPLSTLNLEPKLIINKLKSAYEEESKNWLLIEIKFLLWLIILIVVFVLSKLKIIKTTLRNILYICAVIIFGVILGADPGPMGTVKDFIVTLGKSGHIFLPRVIALLFMLLLVFIANKFICSWGCQVGTLQDLLFRLNSKKGKPVFPKIKVPFIFSNTVRIITFVLMTLFAFLLAFDLIDSIDPFKIFKPLVLSIIGIIFIALILIASLFVYRPWCHFFCPFGLVGWLLEKISIFKIKVNYDKCIGCEKCVAACPSFVMEKILKRKGIIPDCFSCSSCIEACPTNAITFSVGPRKKPPKDKFK